MTQSFGEYFLKFSKKIFSAPFWHFSQNYWFYPYFRVKQPYMYGSIWHTLRLGSQFSARRYFNKKSKNLLNDLKSLFLGCIAYFYIYLGHIMQKNIIYLSHVTYHMSHCNVKCHIMRKISFFTGLAVSKSSRWAFFRYFKNNGHMLPSDITFLRKTCGYFFKIFKKVPHLEVLDTTLFSWHVLLSQNRHSSCH